IFFFFNDRAPPEIYTLSLHDALPILLLTTAAGKAHASNAGAGREGEANAGDRKSTRLNSSHLGISYAVFCLQKQNYNLNAARPHPGELPTACEFGFADFI